MRIVCLNPYLPPPMGGIEKELLAVAGELVALGHEVGVVTTTAAFPSGENEAPDPLPAGVRAWRVRGWWRSTLRGFAPARAPMLVPGLARAVRERRPELVLVFNIGWGPALRPVLGRIAAPVLYRTFYHPPGGRLRHAKIRYLLETVARADRAFVATERERRELVATGLLAEPRVAVIPPGVHLYPEDEPGVARVRAELGLAGKLVIAHSARLSAFKGTGHLIECLPALRRATAQDVVLLLLGDRSNGAFLEPLAHQLGVHPHIRFIGEVRDDRRLRLLLAASDLFALPSEYEAYGIAYIEAQAAGLPCVGCDVGGVREAIGEGGVLVPSFGDREALGAALARLVGDAPLRRRMGQAGRERVCSALTWRHTTERILALAAGVTGD